MNQTCNWLARCLSLRRLTKVSEFLLENSEKLVTDWLIPLTSLSKFSIKNYLLTIIRYSSLPD